MHDPLDPQSPQQPSGYTPLGGPVGDPDAFIELSSYQPSQLGSPRAVIERGIADGVIPGNLRGEIDNPVVAKAALLYLAKYGDVVSQSRFEDRFTSLVIEGARALRGEREGGGTGESSDPTLVVVRRVLTLLDGGFISPAEAEEALTWPSHLAEIERIAAARLLDPPPAP